MKLIIISGIAATGKSTLAAYLSSELGYDIISKDVIKERLFESGIRKVNLRNWWWFERQSWERFFDEVRQTLHGDKSVIIEGNFYGKYAKRCAKVVTSLDPTHIHEVFCDASPGVIYTRYVYRLKHSRHSGHYDHLWRYNFAIELFLVKLGLSLNNRHVLEPTKALYVNTTQSEIIDYQKILRFVRA